MEVDGGKLLAPMKNVASERQREWNGNHSFPRSIHRDREVIIIKGGQGVIWSIERSEIDLG